jgi:tRNA(adenine34) deaminase
MCSLPQPELDEHYMREALREAESAAARDETPIGAVVVRGTSVIGRGHNQREMLKDPTAHAEMLAITAAAQAVGDWRLSDCALYVTLEPCPMCAGAVLQARMGRLVFAAWDPKAGACGSLFELTLDGRLNHSTPTRGGILAEESRRLLGDFFRDRRAEGKK